MTSIIGRSFVGPATARLASMLVACAGLVLLTPMPASHQLDASTEDVIESQAAPDSAHDREWRNDATVSVSDACDDDDDGGDDESTATSGPLTSARRCHAPDSRDNALLNGVAEDRRGSRDRVVHLLRGPPSFPMESSTTADDDPARTRSSMSGGRVDRREPHLPLLCDPFRRPSVRSDYGLRAPP